MHDLYDLVEYTTNPSGKNSTYLEEYNNQIKKCFDIARNAAKVNAYYFLTQQGRVVTWTGVRLFFVERLQVPVVRKRINTFDIKIKCGWKIDDEADVQQAAPTFLAFDSDLVPRKTDKELGPMPDGPSNLYSFTLD